MQKFILPERWDRRKDLFVRMAVYPMKGTAEHLLEYNKNPEPDIWLRKKRTNFMVPKEVIMTTTQKICSSLEMSLYSLFPP